MKFRSGLEEKVAAFLEKEGTPFLYEPNKIKYVLENNYIPDFVLPNGIYIEVKGFLKPSDRRKMIAVRDQNPELDIRFVFQRNNLLAKLSKSTYGDWADKHGFLWCTYPHIPTDWLL